MLEKLLLGLKVAAIGLVLVFAILYLLILAVRLLHVAIGGKKKPEKSVAMQEERLDGEKEDLSSDGALVAAITAAVYACLAEDGQKMGRHPEFIIKKIREIRR